jgi:hypothetical protein
LTLGILSVTLCKCDKEQAQMSTQPEQQAQTPRILSQSDDIRFVELSSKNRSVLAFVNDCPVIVGPESKIIHGLSTGDSIDLFIAGNWQRALVCSGSGRGWYYETESGACGRFATSMQVRFVCVAGEAANEEFSDVGQSYGPVPLPNALTFAEQVASALAVGVVLVRRCPGHPIKAFSVRSAIVRRSISRSKDVPDRMQALSPAFASVA